MPNLPAFNYCQQTIALKHRLEASFLALGERLAKIKTECLYEGQWDDFEAFLAEMKINTSTANRLIQIYQTFILDLKCAPARLAEAGGWTIVSEILPFVKDRKSADHWLDRAKTLTRSDLRRDLTEARNGKDMAKCKHADVYLLQVCRDCGLRTRIYEDESTTK